MELIDKYGFDKSVPLNEVEAKMKEVLSNESCPSPVVMTQCPDSKGDILTLIIVFNKSKASPIDVLEAFSIFLDSMIEGNNDTTHSQIN